MMIMTSFSRSTYHEEPFARIAPVPSPLASVDSYGDVKRVPAAPRYPLRVRAH